jgi:hypothetical protein
LRVPDGCIAAHANQARIGELPRPDPATCRFSPNLVSFAVSRGYHEPASGRPFRFCDAYCPAAPAYAQGTFLALQSLVERAALELAQSDPAFLTRTPHHALQRRIHSGRAGGAAERRIPRILAEGRDPCPAGGFPGARETGAN